MSLFFNDGVIPFIFNDKYISGDKYDANKLTETGIYKIASPTIKNANGVTWSFLVNLKYDVNSTMQFLIATDSKVTMYARKLSPTGFSTTSDWHRIGGVIKAAYQRLINRMVVAG